MKIVLYKDWSREQISFHALPSLDFFKASYICDIQFSWLAWTLEITLWKETE